MNVFPPTRRGGRHAKSWRRARPKIALAALLLAGLAPPAGWASDSRDHERARAAVEAGQVLPLPTLLERLRRTHPGQVLELELEREDGRWIYELEPSGSGTRLRITEYGWTDGFPFFIMQRVVGNPDAFLKFYVNRIGQVLNDPPAIQVLRSR